MILKRPGGDINGFFQRASRIIALFTFVGVAGLASMAAHANQGVINSLPDGVWCEKSQYEDYGNQCASGRPRMKSVRIFVFGPTIEININSNTGSFEDYRGGLEGLRIKGRISWRDQNTPDFNCRNIAGFSGVIAADGRTITVTKQNVKGFRNCTVTKWGPEETVVFVRLR